MAFAPGSGPTLILCLVVYWRYTDTGRFLPQLADRTLLPPAPHLSDELAATTLYAARGHLMPCNSNSPTGSTFTALSTFISTRGTC
jgi:hypothetical protein